MRSFLNSKLQFVFILTFCSLLVIAQEISHGSQPIIIPIFKSAKDSTTYIRLDSTLKYSNFQMNNKKDMEVLDSLGKKISVLKDKSIGHRFVYKPRFVSLESLKTEASRKEATRISISIQGLKQLPIALFDCENLEFLELVNTSIKVIPHNLEKLPKLKCIEIYNNQPSKRLKIKKNNKIETLIIRGEKPEFIPRNYKKVSSLTLLDLSRNHLVNAPKTSGNKQLKEIHLVENDIKNLKIKGKQMPSVSKFDIRYNKLEVLPSCIAKFSNLQTLLLNYNRISRIDNGIGKLKELKFLSFYENKLEFIPDALYDLNGLIYLDLYFNFIKKIDEKIICWKNISSLHLAHNQLQTLPENIGELDSLDQLYTQNNHLSQLPSSIGKLKKLRALRIDENEFTSFPKEILECISIEQLDISKNRIKTIAPELFELEHLKLLSIQKNLWDSKSQAIIKLESEKLKAKNIIFHYDD